MGKQISLSSIQELVRVGELEKMFKYFGKFLEITVPLEDGKLYNQENWEKVRTNISAIKEYLGKNYRVDPQIVTRDLDREGNINMVKYSVKITRR